MLKKISLPIISLSVFALLLYSLHLDDMAFQKEWQHHIDHNLNFDEDGGGDGYLIWPILLFCLFWFEVIVCIGFKIHSIRTKSNASSFFLTRDQARLNLKLFWFFLVVFSLCFLSWPIIFWTLEILHPTKRCKGQTSNTPRECQNSSALGIRRELQPILCEHHFHRANMSFYLGSINDFKNHLITYSL